MKDAYYFSHDSNASQDEKILNLRADHGWEGYGIYWAIIERLRDSSDHKYKNDSIKGLSVSLGIKRPVLEEIVNNYDLFDSDEDCFWSPSLMRRMDIVEKKRGLAKKASKARWVKNVSDTNAAQQVSENDANTDADAMQMQCGCNADASIVQCEIDADAMQGNEMKLNEMKLNESKEKKEKKEKKEVFDEKTIQQVKVEKYERTNKPLLNVHEEIPDGVLTEDENKQRFDVMLDSFFSSSAWFETFCITNKISSNTAKPILRKYFVDEIQLKGNHNRTLKWVRSRFINWYNENYNKQKSFS